MKKSFSKFFLAPLTVLVLASFALAPVAEAGRGGGGGGGARAGGGAHAGGGDRQINNSNRDVRANNVTVPLGSTEIWEFVNKSGGWFHPTHIHLVDFKVLTRNGKPAFPWEQGPKDVVYVGENESVRVLVQFNQGKGRYMIHCHNLPHEDHDMMVQFEVGSGGADPMGMRSRVTNQMTPLW